jgi:hypothetical protein
MLRTAASLKRGWVPASLLITRLKNATPQSPLAAALGEYGRIVRTNFVLRDCADPVQRARVAGQLNKGESLHAMRRHLVIGARAQIPADEDDHRRHAVCLQLLGNAMQVWNARYMTAATTTSTTHSPTSLPTTQPSPASHRSRTRTSTLSAATTSTASHPAQVCDRCAASTRISSVASRRHRSASVATNTKRWISRR